MKKSKSNPELKNIIEAALLVAGEPLTLERLAALFPDGAHPAREQLRAAIDELENDYANRGIELRQIEKGWRIQTREKYAGYVARAVETRPPRYSRSLLETLAIIVYRQPVTRGDIEEIRGVTVSTETIRTLHDREWVREVGRREVPGRPVLYGTTRQFLEHFNLKSLADMPPLSELRSIEEIGAELDQRLAQSLGAARPAASEEPPATGDDSDSLSAESAAVEAAAPHRGG
ncbi:MAG: SMC-Scp complex subunit ScpB [Pseudomonadota bacterium]